MSIFHNKPLREYKKPKFEIGDRVRISKYVADVLPFHEQEFQPTTSLDENSIEFGFQTDRNVYVDLRQTYVALIIKLVQRRGFDI